MSIDKQTRWQRWLRRKLGYDYVCTVDEVQFGYRKPLRRFSDDNIQLLTKLPRLKDIAFYDTDVTADGLKPLRSLKHLERIFLDQMAPGSGEGLNDLPLCTALRKLVLCRTPLPQKGLAFLRSMPQLEKLSLHRIDLHDDDFPHIAYLRKLHWLEITKSSRPSDGLAFLSSLEQLWFLRLHRMELEDDDLRQISCLHRLSWLYLSDNPFGDRGLAHLSRLKNVTSLNLTGTQISSDGIGHLIGMSNLRQLKIAQTEVDDNAVDDLCQLHNLRELDLCGTNLTSEGVSKLRRELGRCSILWPERTPPSAITTF